MINKEKSALVTATTGAVEIPSPYNAYTGKFKHNEIGDYVISLHGLFCICNSGEPKGLARKHGVYKHIEEDGVYMNVTDELESYLIELYEDITRTQRREVLAYIRAVAPIKDKGELDGEIIH